MDERLQGLLEDDNVGRLWDLELEAGSLGDKMTFLVFVCLLVFIRYSDQ